MVSPPDSLVTRKLALVKQLYDHAVMQAPAGATQIRRIISLVVFDLTVETALKVVVTALDSSKTPKEDFPSLLQQAESVLQASGIPQVPDRVNILHVHSLRNDAQHKAKYPLPEDVEEARLYVRDFLTKLYQDVWGIQFSTFTLIDLIRDDKPKQYLTEAQSAIEAGDFKKCCDASNAALAVAVLIARHILFPGARSRFHEGFGLINWRFDTHSRSLWLEDVYRPLESTFRQQAEDFKRDIEDLRQRLSRFREQAIDEFDALEDLLILPILGLSHSEIASFRAIAGHVQLTGSEETPYVVRGGKADIDRYDAEAVLAFAVNAVLQIEGRIAEPE